MKLTGRLQILSWIGASALLFGLAGCGSDSGSGSSDPEYSSATEASSGSTGSSSASTGGSSGSTASSSASTAKSSASTETQSSDEQLNEAQKVVSGSCGPEASTINKGELATWKFYRSSGDVYEQILAPFVWAFEGGSSTTVQGNGLQTVNVRYEEAGTYAAYLNVDGNEIACDPLQVQGIPITVNSCVANSSTAKAGETITWTVDATSESDITGYTWTSSYGDVTGSGTSGSMVATSSMHKQNVTATVAVANADKSVVTFSCEGVTVIDPESVDLVLPLGSINSSDYEYTSGLVAVADSLVIPSQTAMTVQIPTGAPSNCTVGCKPINSSDYMSLSVYWDSDEA
ncbi:MAG: hypothetical protein K6A31_03260, partial [Fibrobacter sp.]|nr:hypothetical protein [Fibrobacter sp.]